MRHDLSLVGRPKDTPGLSFVWRSLAGALEIRTKPALDFADLLDSILSMLSTINRRSPAYKNVAQASKTPTPAEAPKLRGRVASIVSPQSSVDQLGLVVPMAREIHISMCSGSSPS